MITVGIIILAVYKYMVYASNDSSSNVTMSTILDDIFRNYDKKLPPNWNETGFDRQVLVEVEMFVQSMFQVNEADMDYSMSIFLRERWVDKRLTYEDTLNLTRLVLDISLFDKVWMPDVFILSEKWSDYHEVMVPNKLIHVYPDGTVQYSARVTGSFGCMMHLQKYPFDVQTCHFDVESYGHSTETMKLVWSGNAVTTAKSIEFPEFSLTDVKHYGCDKAYYGIMYPCIGVTFKMERKYAYHIIQIFVPSALIVILSWVNFWLDCTATPARISLGLLTVLTMTTQSSGVRANLPRVSYLKAIDVYMATCLAFVFIGLVEFAYVNVLTRVEIRQQGHNELNQLQDDDDATRRQFYSIKTPHVTKPTEKDKSKHQRTFWCGHFWDISPARRIDKISRILFPVVFIMFNIAYWAYYFTWEMNLGEQ